MEVTGNIFSFETFGILFNVIWSIVIGASGIVAGVFIQGRK